MTKISFSNNSFQKDVYSNLNSSIDSLSNSQRILSNMDIPFFDEKIFLENLYNDLSSIKNRISDYSVWSKEINRKLDLIESQNEEDIFNINLIDVAKH